MLRTLEPLNPQGTTLILRPPASTSRWYSLTGAEIFVFSVCSSCKSPPSVRLEEGFLPAGLCKLLEIKDYIISYHPFCLAVCSCLLSGSMHTSLLVLSQHRCCWTEAETKPEPNLTIENICTSTFCFYIIHSCLRLDMTALIRVIVVGTEQSFTSITSTTTTPCHSNNVCITSTVESNS